MVSRARSPGAMGESDPVLVTAADGLIASVDIVDIEEPKTSKIVKFYHVQSLFGDR